MDRAAEGKRHGLRVSILPDEGAVVRRLGPHKVRPVRRRDIADGGAWTVLDRHRLRGIARLHFAGGHDESDRLADMAYPVTGKRPRQRVSWSESRNRLPPAAGTEARRDRRG